MMDSSAIDFSQIDIEDIDLIERYWQEKSRVNFFAYRRYLRHGNFQYNWFVIELSKAIQDFYVDFRLGKRPILVITVPPQHGKSMAIEDAVTWISGKDPDIKMIYGSFSEFLGTRCNSNAQKTFISRKYQSIFPETQINDKNVVTIAAQYKRNSSLIEFVGKMGSFRNTTVLGPITGESLDIGFIDDPLKGRKEANSKVIRDGVWNWFVDDFNTRFADHAGYIVTMTRWHVDDLVGRLLKKYDGAPNLKIINFPAIAENDEKYRKIGQALFPGLKSLSFLNNQKALRLESSWLSLYQGKPSIEGGNIIKEDWWKWWEDSLPKFKFAFAVADTAQKKNNWNDWTVFQHWAYGVDGNIYLLDLFRDRVMAPDLRRKAELFYLACERRSVNCAFRGLAIEDKSSGIGLIQELEEKRLKVFSIPRNNDKLTRAHDCGPEIKIGKIFLNSSIPGVDILLTEASEFPNGEFDDTFDCTMNAIECAFIYPHILNSTIYVS